MKIQELIDLLNKVEDKEQRVMISYDSGFASQDIDSVWQMLGKTTVFITAIN